MDDKKGFNWLLLGYLFLGIIPLPYLGVAFVKLPLVTNPDNWAEKWINNGPFIMFWLLLLAGISFLFAGLKQHKIYYFLCVTCLLIAGIMLAYYLMAMQWIKT